MSNNRFKKILKSNKFKFSLLCATTFAFLLASGKSFAKYYTEHYTGQNVNIAKVDIQAHFDYAMVEMPGSIYNADYGIYLQVATFYLDFSYCEVKVNYNINLKLGGEYSAEYDDASPVSNTYFSMINNSPTFREFIKDSQGNIEIQTTNINEYLGTNNISYNSNTSFYAIGNENNGNITYTWYSITNNDTYNLSLPFRQANTKDKHFYKVLYFVDINASGAENSVILGNISATQVM